METVSDFILGGLQNHCRWWFHSHEIKRHLLLRRNVMTNLDSIFKSGDITLLTKVCLVKAMVFLWSCMDVRVGLWRRLSAEELMLLNCDVGEGSWESLGLPGHSTSPSERKSVLNIYWKDWCCSWNSNTWPLDGNWLIWKDLDTGKDWRQEEKGTTEDEMVGWHHWLNGHEFE